MSIRKNMKILHKFLKKDDWRYEFDEGTGVFQCGVQIGNAVGNARIFLNVQDEHVVCALVLPHRAVEESRAAVAELVCRINYRLMSGGFELDYNDGEIRYCYVMPSEELCDDPMNKAKRLVYLPYMMALRYGTAFVKVILGVRKPAEALKECDPDAVVGDIAVAENDDDSPVAAAKDGDVPVGKDGKCTERADGGDSASVPVPVRDYTLDGLSIKGDIPLAKVVAAVRRFREMQSEAGVSLPDRPRMNLLLWGPPGTGKTEFVNYLGQQLGCKVVVKMASDLLDHWVGKTEKAIRAAFEEAEEENAILFLDELDGLMQDRSGAIANWEVTQVNELLDCMERFKGVMVGATNFMEHLDAAVLRRFTYKLEFGYLEPDGKRIFFDRAFKTPLTEKDARRLDAIPNLAPGDFKTVSQRLFYLGDEVGNEERLSALEQEVAFKKRTHNVCLGFSAA